MTNAELIAALRWCDACKGCGECPVYNEDRVKCHHLMNYAANALEAADAWEKVWTQKCERLEKRIAELEAQNEQLQDAFEKVTKTAAEYQQRIVELKAQLPKEGEWIHGKELCRSFVGDCCVGIVYEDFRCSACGVKVEKTENPKWKYCPNCGAKMS